MKRIFSLIILLTFAMMAFGQKLTPEDFFALGKAKEVEICKVMRQSGFQTDYRTIEHPDPEFPAVTNLCFSIACNFDSIHNVIPPYESITGCVKVSFFGKHLSLIQYQTTDRMLFGEFIKTSRDQLFQKYDVNDDGTGRTTTYQKNDIMLSFKEGNDGLYTVQCEYPQR